jgi:hypothetical protein
MILMKKMMMKKKIDNQTIMLNQKYLKENMYNIPSIMGEIYELHCYNYILDNFRNINIVKCKCMEVEKYGNFAYSTNGKILLCSNNIILAEYDALGVSQNKIYWWEITRYKRLEKEFLLKLKMKENLLKKLFNNYEIIVNIITTKNFEKLKEYQVTIINEPDYDLFSRKYKLSNNIKNAMSLKCFSGKSVKYDYLNDLIKYAEYFNDKSKYEMIKQEYIINRIFDLESINEPVVKFYDLKNDKIRKVKISGFNKTIFKNRLVQEIFGIRRRLKKIEPIVQ